MRSFEYVRPQTLAEAVKLLDSLGSDVKILAGGTDLLIQLRNRELQPSAIMDLKQVRELQDTIRIIDRYVSIPATTTISDIISSPFINQYFPALIDAASSMGSVQVRNRATLAGNICNASPAADTAPPLLVYNAEVVIVSARGMRRININDFFIRSGITALQSDELVISVEIPIPEKKIGAGHLRRTRRRGHDLASVTLCCGVDETKVVRLAYGSVGPRPVLVVDKSGVLTNENSPDETKAAIFESMFIDARPSPKSMRAGPKYRLAMLYVLGNQALGLAITRLKGEQ